MKNNPQNTWLKKNRRRIQTTNKENYKTLKNLKFINYVTVFYIIEGYGQLMFLKNQNFGVKADITITKDCLYNLD